MDSHAEKVATLSVQVKQAYSQGKQIKTMRNSGNVTRTQTLTDQFVSVDMRSFVNILELDSTTRTINVEPGVSMDILAKYLLENHFILPVTPEFPGITVGGAIQGGALESSSFKFGQFNENVLEIEFVLGDGSCILATPQNEYADLFWGVSTSYGSLALITRIKLKTIPAKRFVALHIIRYDSIDKCTSDLLSFANKGEQDFIEGIIFSSSHAIIVSGKLSDSATSTLQDFRHNTDPWYYRFMFEQANGTTVSTPLYDYLFRYDKGAFWMGEYLFSLFGLSSNRLTRFLFAPFLHTRKLYDGLHAYDLGQQYVIQDLYLNNEDILPLLQLNEKDVRIYPLWLCPIKSSPSPQNLSSNKRSAEQMLLNVGVYGRPKLDAITVTKELESFVANSNESRKMLYADTYFSEKEFWKIYNENWYSELRNKYHADSFRPIYSKIHSPEVRVKPQKFVTTLQLIKESLRGRNMIWK